MGEASGANGAGEAPAPRAARLEPGRFTRFLWFCAGADGELLARCPVSDWVKFQSLGGIVLATGWLAFVSAAYAFYTVFSPKDATALAATTDWSTVVSSVLAGAVWALVIFNIDRFIVSSAGKGDGTERITGAELVGALPRLVMALIIGVCISAPLEIRILKPEIDAQLELEQNAYLKELDGHAEAQVEGKRKDLGLRLDKAQAQLDERTSYFEKRRLEINTQRRELELEAEGKTGSGHAGRGPAWQDKKDTLDKLEAELARDAAAFKEKEARVLEEMAGDKAALSALASGLDAQKQSNLRQSRHLDGLLKRIEISHAIGGAVPWAIMLLLLAVETGPIFFKMMLVKSSYDYLLENQKRVAAASEGIELDAHVFLSEMQEEIRVDAFHAAETRLMEQRRRLATEQQIAELVHARLEGELAREQGRPGDKA
jgi:Domain of unknown function (DUF4407)